MTFQVHQFPCLSDNYGFLLHDGATGETVAIDTPEVDAINRELEAKGWALTAIWNTHHHFDHAGGNEALKDRWGAQVIGAEADAHRLPGLDLTVKEGDCVFLGAHEARVIETPGHTTGHIAYYFEDSNRVFVGDTLFALGCGRLFEGTPAQMWDSLSKLMALPDQTAVYCAHEYTAANAAFAVTVDADNDALAERAAWVAEQRARSAPTVPTDIGTEKATNPFLRAEDPVLAAGLGLQGEAPVAVFAETRRRKDAF